MRQCPRQSTQCFRREGIRNSVNRVEQGVAPATPFISPARKCGVGDRGKEPVASATAFTAPVSLVKSERPAKTGTTEAKVHSRNSSSSGLIRLFADYSSMGAAIPEFRKPVMTLV